MTPAPIAQEPGPARPPGANGRHAHEPGAAAGAPDVELDTGTVTAYLLRKGVLHPEQVVAGRLVVEDISRRNRNFRVRTREGAGFLVKQAKSAGSARSTLRTEAQILRFVATDDSMVSFRPHAPEYVCFDPRNGVLVTRLIHPATSITKLHLYYGKIEFPEEFAAAAGKLLGLYHDAGSRAIARGAVPFLQRQIPNGFHCPTPEFLLANGTPSGPAYWQLLAGEPLLRRLPDLRERWAGFDGIVHGDARWDNYLLTHGKAPGGGPNLRIIDWEMAHVGDSVWDAACFVGDYLRFAISVAGVHKLRTAEELLARPPYPPAKHRASMRAFWDAYCATRGFTRAQRWEALDRVFGYLPFYLVLAGYEMTQAHATSGRRLRELAEGKMALHFARRAADRADDIVQEWFSLD